MNNIVDNITVLGPDEPKKPLGFTINEYIGSAIQYYLDGDIVVGLNDLKVGMKVVAWGNISITIDSVIGTTATGMSGVCKVLLDHGVDNRNCWVAMGVINTRGIKQKVDISLI